MDLDGPKDTICADTRLCLAATPVLFVRCGGPDMGRGKGQTDRLPTTETHHQIRKLRKVIEIGDADVQSGSRLIKE